MFFRVVKRGGAQRTTFGMNGAIKKLGPIVQTGDGLLLLRELQLAGKRPQSGWDFVNGTHLSVVEILANG